MKQEAKFKLTGLRLKRIVIYEEINRSGERLTSIRLILIASSKQNLSNKMSKHE